MKIFIRLLGAILAFSMLAAAAQTTAHTAAVSWTAPATNTDGTAITGTLTYTLYQGTQPATGTATLASVQTGITTASATVTAGLTPGTTQCFAVAATANGVASAQSAQACAAIPFSTPGVPTQITVVIH